MEAHAYFGLRTAPFEGRPDPRFYYAAPGHTETLATLRYAVHAGKTCSLVLGDSGSGKTIIGRLLAKSVNSNSYVLWINGIGQPQRETELTVLPPGALGRSTPIPALGPAETTLADWLRAGNTTPTATLVVVDNADGLRRQGWEDLLALLTREFRLPKPISVVLLGLPTLVQQIARPQLVRLRRRVFRTCQIMPLNREEAAAYVAHRLTVAGGGESPFTPAAMDMVHRLSGGNPAQINQLCDNALIDAFGDERRQIDAPHVLAVARLVVGPHVTPRRLEAPPVQRLGASSAAQQPRLTSSLTRLEGDLDLARALVAGNAPIPPGRQDFEEFSAPTAPAQDVRPGSAPEVQSDALASATTFETAVPAIIEEAPLAIEPAAVRAGASVVVQTQREVAGLDSSQLVERLRVVEVRITEALSRVRAARSQRFATITPDNETPAVTEPLDLANTVADAPDA